MMCIVFLLDPNNTEGHSDCRRQASSLIPVCLAQWLVQHRTTAIHPISHHSLQSSIGTFVLRGNIIAPVSCADLSIPLLLEPGVKLHCHPSRSNPFRRRAIFNPPLRSRTFIEQLELVLYTSRSSYPQIPVYIYLSEHGRQLLSA